MDEGGDNVFPSTPEADVTVTPEPKSPESKPQIHVEAPPPHSLPLQSVQPATEGAVSKEQTQVGHNRSLNPTGQRSVRKGVYGQG